MVTTNRPHRIEWNRFAGGTKPPGSALVTRATRFGNPYKVGAPGVPDRAAAVALLDVYLTARRNGVDVTATHPDIRYPTDQVIKARLAGLNLICCPTDSPCHADLLLAIAND